MFERWCEREKDTLIQVSRFVRGGVALHFTSCVDIVSLRNKNNNNNNNNNSNNNLVLCDISLKKNWKNKINFKRLRYQKNVSTTLYVKLFFLILDFLQ